MSWGSDRPVPRCPKRIKSFYQLPPENIAALSEEQRSPTEEELEDNAGCLIVTQWESLQHDTVAMRSLVCDGCALRNGQWPKSNTLYNKAERHLSLHEIGLAPSRSEYSKREIEAILTVYLEREKVKSEMIQNSRGK